MQALASTRATFVANAEARYNSAAVQVRTPIALQIVTMAFMQRGVEGVCRET